MDLLLRYGEIGLRQDLLIKGKEYDVYRNGKHLGVATYAENEQMGDGFFKKIVIKGIKDDEGKPVMGLEVFVADEWEFT